MKIKIKIYLMSIPGSSKSTTDILTSAAQTAANVYSGQSTSEATLKLINAGANFVFENIPTAAAGVYGMYDSVFNSKTRQPQKFKTESFNYKMDKHLNKIIHEVSRSKPIRAFSRPFSHREPSSSRTVAVYNPPMASSREMVSYRPPYHPPVNPEWRRAQNVKHVEKKKEKVLALKKLKRFVYDVENNYYPGAGRQVKKTKKTGKIYGSRVNQSKCIDRFGRYKKKCKKFNKF